MNSFNFLAIGKTRESAEAVESKKYIGIGSSRVLAVNPSKAELEKIYGHDIANEPEYTGSKDGVDFVRIDFIVKTDPDSCGGIEAISRATIFLRNKADISRDGAKVRVIDQYGNTGWTSVEDAKLNKKILTSEGRDAKITDKYRPAYQGEADLVSFLKTYLNMEDAFSYIDGSWVLKENPADYQFALEHIKSYLHGDVSEIREILALQPNNKIKLLYGVRTTDRGQFQSVCTRDRLMLRNSANSTALARAEKELANARQHAQLSDTEYEICELHEYTAETTDLSAPSAAGSADADTLPWD